MSNHTLCQFVLFCPRKTSKRMPVVLLPSFLLFLVDRSNGQLLEKKKADAFHLLQREDGRRIQHGMEGMETKLGIPYRKGKGMEADEKLELGIIQENTQKVPFIQHDSRPPGGWKKTDDPRNMNSSVVLTKPTGFQGDQHGKRRGDSTGNRGRKCSSFNKLLAEDQEIEHVILSRVRTKKCRLTNGVKSEGGSTRSTSQINAPDRFVSISESGGDSRREEAEKQG
ncbi:hypothetical protein B0H11DRAFT_1940410 [Mycena galericulata]|nr:hypothetical protein B0H11DRAFT_1940410 [Mycena galericulata]